MERPRAAQRIFFSASEVSKSAPRGFQDSKRQPRSPDAPRRIKEASWDRFHPLWDPFGCIFCTILGPLLVQIVNASRIPPRPSAGHVARDCRACSSWRLGKLLWRALGGSLGAPKPSSGGLLEASWTVPEPSWKLLESLGGSMAGLGGVLGDAGKALESYKRRLGGSLSRLGSSGSHVAAIWRPKGSQNGAQKRSPIELQRRFELKTAKP